jgi:predicted NBD/HSP70 family sugar kinase
MKGVSSKKVRDRAVILDLVRRLGPQSRVDIHRLTHLRQGTISLLVRELLRENRLVEGGLSDNPMGRKQVLLRLNEDFGYIGAIEFDAEQVVTAVLNLNARIKFQSVEPTVLNRGVEGLVGQLVDCARKAVIRASADRIPLLALGVADPGLIDSRAGVSVTSSTIDFWRKVPLRGIFEKEFRVPFLLESNTRARTVAERTLGAGAGAADMLYLDYGTGIGLGVITEGRLLRGSRECAAEFGHTHVMPDGPACQCGSFGCLEAIAGAPAMAARARKAVREGGASKVVALAGNGPITAMHVLEAARQGDKLCGALVEDVTRYLGLGLANIVNLFNPSLVVLDRRLGAADPGFLDQVTRAVRRGALQHAIEGLTFRFSELGEEAGVLGVALLAIEKLFEIPVLHAPKFMTEAAHA